MKRTIFCNHYRALSEHKTCEAGVEYATLQEKVGKAFANWPCFARNGQPVPGGCELACFPTAEELAAEEAEMKKRFESIGAARQAIVAHLGGPWKRGTPGASGAIDCPVCRAEKALRFSRAGCNGHIHASCTTEGCVAWME